MLQYLEFDYSEDEQEQGCFEAMASVPSSRLPALQDEIALVLDWALATFAGQQAPLEEGGEWDYLLESQREWSQPGNLRYDAATRQFSDQPGQASAVRHVLTLSISGTAMFCEAFRERFGI